MNKIKKVLLAIPVFFITLYSKVRATENIENLLRNSSWIGGSQPEYGVPGPEFRYRYVYWIVLVPLAAIVLGIVGLINVKMKNNPSKRKIVITICLMVGICILVGVFFVIRNLIT